MRFENFVSFLLRTKVSQATPLVQETLPSWDDDDDEQSDVATTVVESTLADV